MAHLPDGAVGVPPQESENRKRLADFFLRLSKSNRSQGGASSSNVFNVPEKVKKTPLKKKTRSNKKVEALKKKVADDRAKHLKAVKKLKDLKLSVALEKRKKLAQKRKSLLQKDEKIIQTLKAKRHK